MSKSGVLRVETLGTLCRLRNLASLAPTAVQSPPDAPNRPTGRFPVSRRVNRNSLNQNVFEFCPHAQSQPVESRARWCLGAAKSWLFEICLFMVWLPQASALFPYPSLYYN